MADIDALLAEQGGAKSSEDKQRMSLLLSQRLSVLRDRASSRTMQSPQQQPQQQRRAQESRPVSTASVGVSMDEIDALLAENSASRPVSSSRPASVAMQQQVCTHIHIHIGGVNAQMKTSIMITDHQHKL